jgi:hypothetical protein
MPMFDDAFSAVQAVAQDLSKGFKDIFEEVTELTAVGLFAQEAVGTVSEALSVVAWEWPVVHVGSIQGISATGRSVTLRGVTVIELASAVIEREREENFVDEGEGDLMFSRYIDWLGLYAELGAVTIARPQVDDRSNIPDNVPHDVDL